METVDGMMQPQWKETISMNTKYSRTMAKPKYDPKSKHIINAPQGYQKIKVHLVFACKHDGHHKAQLVAAGNMTPDPIGSTYSGVLSTRSLRLLIFLAKLNNMEVRGADIGNANLEATTKERYTSWLVQIPRNYKDTFL